MTLSKRDWIAGLEKGLAILEAFDYNNPRMTPTQVAARTGITRTAARRHLLTLAHLGYLVADGKSFVLTPRVLKVGWSYFDSAPLPRILHPFLQQVTGALHESAYASVFDNWEQVCIARNGTTRVMTTGFVLGARVPAQFTAAGLVMLGFQPQDKVQEWLTQHDFPSFTPYTITDPTYLSQEIAKAHVNGYAIVDQQLQIGVRGIAVPILNRHATLIGAIHVSIPMAGETQKQVLERVLPVLQQTANSLINYV
jgi:IclR family pca regulon transcriptional regulator